MAGSLSCPCCWAPFRAGKGVDSVTRATGAPVAELEASVTSLLVVTNSASVG